MKTGTKCRLIGIGMLIMLALYVAATVVLHFAGIDTRIVHSGVDVGKPSPDGQFRLVELSDHTGRYLLYSVIRLGGDGRPPETLFMTDDFWYYSRYIKAFYWIDDTNDFCIESTDSGLHRYNYENGTWKPEGGWSSRFEGNGAA